MYQEIPQEFICPITGEIMTDPAVVDDGHTFQRTAIIEWFCTGKKTNPITNLELKNFTLRPNFALKSLIQKHKIKSSLTLKGSQNEEKIKTKVKQFALKQSGSQKIKQQKIEKSSASHTQVFPEGWGGWSASNNMQSNRTHHNWNNSNSSSNNGSWQNWGNNQSHNNNQGGIFSFFN